MTKRTSIVAVTAAGALLLAGCAADDSAGSAPAVEAVAESPALADSASSPAPQPVETQDADAPPLPAAAAGVSPRPPMDPVKVSLYGDADPDAPKQFYEGATAAGEKISFEVGGELPEDLAAFFEWTEASDKMMVVVGRSEPGVLGRIGHFDLVFRLNTTHGMSGTDDTTFELDVADEYGAINYAAPVEGSSIERPMHLPLSGSVLHVTEFDAMMAEAERLKAKYSTETPDGTVYFVSLENRIPEGLSLPENIESLSFNLEEEGMGEYGDYENVRLTRVQ